MAGAQLRVDLLRGAVRRAVEASSQRKVARQIGMSAPGLRAFLDGARPLRPTWRKLHAWYFRHGVHTPMWRPR